MSYNVVHSNIPIWGFLIFTRTYKIFPKLLYFRGRVRQTYTFDFFNYAGIDRPVFLYHTPSFFIHDIGIKTYINNTTGLYLRIFSSKSSKNLKILFSGIVNYKINTDGTIKNANANDVTYEVSVVDENEKIIATADSLNGNIVIPKANLWWPYLMSDTPGYQYTFRVSTLKSYI